MNNHVAPVSRRRFLAMSAAFGAGVVGAGSLLAACGSESTGDGPANDIAVVQRFSNSGLVPGEIRLPVSLADQKGILDDEATRDYAELNGHVIDMMTGKTVVESVSATKHGEGLALPYWPFTVNIEKTGTYALVIDGTSKDGAAFQVIDPKSVKMPTVGNALPAFDTPTVDDARGVDPICTLTPGACPFHGTTLTDALKSGRPVVYLIGTPAHCQTGTCAPALQALVEVAGSVGDAAVFVHAEVYSDKNATTLAPAVEAYKLQFEPILFVADADGILRKRLDGVFDVNEVRETLAQMKIT
ncbi:MAG: hypothetical protein RLZZ526_36 [Actinomycetota bacterium]|jgi:hypothetical protein